MEEVEVTSEDVEEIRPAAESLLNVQKNSC
jgi:hypothetical protein